MRFDPTAQALQGVLLAMLAIGVLVMSSEYATGMIRTSLAAVPKRRTLLLAKAIIVGTVGLIVSMFSAFVAFFCGQAVLSSEGIETTLDGTNVMRAVLGAGAFLTLIALLGLALLAWVGGFFIAAVALIRYRDA